MCVLSGLKLLSCSLLSVCGSVLFLILQEAAETHTGMNRSFRGLKGTRDEISMLLTSHSLRRKMFLKTLTLSLTIAMPLAQQRLTTQVPGTSRQVREHRRQETDLQKFA